MRRGASLVELLISLALLAGLGVLVVMFLVPAMRVTARGAAQVTLQQQGVLALSKLAMDLQRTTPHGLSLLILPPPSCTALGIVPVVDVSGQRTLVWDDSMRVYFWDPATRRMVRRTWPAPGGPPPVLTFSPSQPPLATATELDAICSTATATDIMLAAGVTNFTVTYPGSPGPLQQPLTLRAVLQQKAVSGEQVETFAVSRTVYLRNSGNPQ